MGINFDAPYRHPILDLFLSAKDWKVVRKCLDSSTRKSFRIYQNIKGQRIGDLYPYQFRECDRLAEMMSNPKAKWAKKYREHLQQQQIKPRHRQMELWEVKPTDAQETRPIHPDRLGIPA